MTDEAASPRASSGDTASSSSPKPAAEDAEGPEVDPAEPFVFVWRIVAGASAKAERWFADDLLGNLLPLAFELAGRDDAANAVRETLTRGHPKRARLVGATGSVAAVLVAIVAVVSVSLLKSAFVVVADAAASVLGARRPISRTTRCGAQSGTPRSAARWVSCGNGASRGRARCGPTSSCCGSPAAAGGASPAVVVATLVCALTALAFWIDCVFFLAFEAVARTSWLPWYLKLVVCVLVLLGWGFLGLLALAGLARAQEEARLATDPDSPVLPALAYGDAEGEVARVLLCTDFFGVLEVPVTADDKEIKKAYRKKLIETHPDKNPGKARCEEAFDRVKTAFEKIGTTDNRDDYLRALAEAHARMHHAAAGGPASSGHAPSPGARASKGPEPAPRSQGPRGRKARRGHRNHG
jgi:hypothetical protein